MRILVLGAGMYVTGRGDSGPGSILASLAQWSRTHPLDEVTVAATRPENAAVVEEAAVRVNQRLGSALVVGYEAAGNDLPGLLAGRDFNAAVVAVPDHLHFELTRVLLGRGLPCLVVKPLTATLSEGRELVRLAAERQVHTTVEFHKRYDEQNRYARRILQEGRLGRPLYVTVDFSQRIVVPDGLFRSWAARTNIFQYLGVHYVDMIHYLTGYRPLRASAVGTRGLLAGRGIDTWDSVHATVCWTPAEGDGTLVSQFAVNWIDPASTSAMSDQKYKIVGEKGRLELDQKNRGLELVLEETGVQAVNPYFSDYLPDDDGRLRFQGYGVRCIERFLQDVVDIREGRTSARELERIRPSFSEALVSTSVIEAVNASLAADGAWQEVADARS